MILDNQEVEFPDLADYAICKCGKGVERNDGELLF